MAHAITLTDGTTTVNLYNTPTLFVTQWDLAAPEEDRDTVGEALDLLITAASAAALQTVVRQIETLLSDAARRDRTRVGARVFLTVQWDGEASAWRSEVVSGRLEVTGAAEQYSSLKIEATLGITRRPYWEGPETQIPLSNSVTANDTAGLATWNHDDTGTGHDNWVQIASGDVAGVLPAPLKIELKNTFGSSVTWGAFHLANNALSDVSGFAHILEAEARTSGGTVTANANASGGYDVRLTSYTSGAQLVWDLSATLLGKTLGRWFRLLLVPNLRSALDAQVESVQAEVMDASGAVALWRGPEVALPRAAICAIADLGTLPLPPAGYSSAWGGLKLRLTFRLVSGTATTYIDFLQITPTDSYQVIEMRPLSVANNAYVVSNGYEGVAYVETGGVRAPLVAPRGDPLMVFPGRTQRIYVLATYQDDIITHTWAVRAWYRPRRLSL